MRSLTLLAGLAAATALAGSGLQAQNPNPWVWRGTATPGRTLEVRGVKGWIHAERASGSEIEVTAQKTAGRSDPDDVRILVTEDEEGVLICALYPGRSRRGGQVNRCGRDGDHQNIEAGQDIAVRYTVRVPDGVDFIGSMADGDVVATGLGGSVSLGSVSGDVVASRLTGRVSASSVSGSVDVETSSGDATANSVSGDLNVTIRGHSERPLHFSTVSGRITLALPRDIGADLELTTLSGSLRSSFPLSSRGRASRPSRRSGRIGDGGRLLSFNTLSGDVDLRPLP